MRKDSERPRPVAEGDDPGVEDFLRELSELGAEVVRTTAEALPASVAGRLAALGAEQVLLRAEQGQVPSAILEALRLEGLDLLEAALPHEGKPRASELSHLAGAEAGLTMAVAGIAETGTVILPGGPSWSGLASLLPPIHVVVLQAGQLYPSLTTWLSSLDPARVRKWPYLTLVTGPSRTADIELTLTLGVHGPGQVILFLVEEAVS